MIPFLMTYAVAFVVFFAIDLIWLGKVAKKLYAKEIGGLLLEHPKWSAAIVFYLIYLVGIVFFAVIPASTSWEALGNGALFGAIAYATYDLTNLATMKNWSFKVTVIDLVWGAFVTGITAFLTQMIMGII